MRISILLALLLFSTPAVSGAFFSKSKVPESFVEIAESHISQVVDNEIAPEWVGARIDSVSELYRTGIIGPAYYEFQVFIGNEPAGFIVVSSRDHDFIIPHWKTSGASPSERILNKYGRENIKRFLKEDVFAYGAELSSGKIVGIGPKTTKSRARMVYEASVSKAASEQWKMYSENKRSNDSNEWTIFNTPGPSPKYGQFEAGVGPNNSACLSGCGATAWAMLFGWADIQADKNDKWKSAWGAYRINGGRGEDTIAPEEMTVGVENMTWEIRGYIGTWCTGDLGATSPWNMLYAKKYLDGRTEVTIDGRYNVFGSHETRIKNFAISYIRDKKTPVIIGTGWLKHYPMAISYAYSTNNDSKTLSEWFYVNQGWEGSGNDWIATGTWFAGGINP